MTRRAGFNPLFIALRGLLEVRTEVLSNEPLPEGRDDGLNHLPHSEELSAGLKEQVFMQQTIVEQSASLFPVTDYHACEGPGLGAHGGDPLGVVDAGHVIVLEEPVACLPQFRFAALVVDLKMKLRLFKSWLGIHAS